MVNEGGLRENTRISIYKSDILLQIRPSSFNLPKSLYIAEMKIVFIWQECILEKVIRYIPPPSARGKSTNIAF